MQKSTLKKVILNLIILAVLVVLIIISANTSSEPLGDALPEAYGSVLSLLPPVVAIVLALISKEVYSSLFAGIVVGALLYSKGNLELAYNTMLYHEGAGLVNGLTDLSHASVLFFVVILATFTTVLNRSGSAEAFGRWAKKHIKSRTGAQIATAVMGLLIFVDDGFNCMTVGSVMRPITDRFNISRSKLAYLIDSTAAPVCIIAPISCWAAAVSYAVPEEYNINGFQMFIRTIPYNMYALVTILMLFLIIALKADYGPMRKHELNAMNGDLFSSDDIHEEDNETDVNPNGKLSNLIIPVAILIFLCIVGMVYTGGFFDGESLINAFANADSARGLVMGSLIALIITLIIYLNRGVMKFRDFMESFAAGFRTMCAPMIILILSWNLSGITGLLGAADFIHTIVESSAAEIQMFVPLVVFVVSVFLAFSTYGGS